MGEVGYAISEEDYQRIQETIRKVERMTQINFRRRMPIASWSPGGGGGPFAPDGNYWVRASPLLMTRADHLKKWIFIDNDNPWPIGVGSDVEATTPADMVTGDPYWFYCANNGGYYIHLRPNIGQSILLPTGVTITYGDDRYLDLGTDGMGYYGGWQLILLAKDPTTWIVWAASSIVVGPI